MPNWKKVIVSGSDAALNSLNVTSEFTASGLIYPTSDGDNGDFLTTDGIGNLSFGRPNVYANVKNISGVQLLKGTPVHATGTAGNASEVIAASASVASTMPATFILNETLADDAEGLAILTGYINGVNTSAFGEGDIVYVGSTGSFTNIKPQGSDNLIQNLGIITKVAASNGSGYVYGSGRSNDVPNLPEGKVWVGSDTYTVTSSVAHLDETNERLGINTNTPGASLDVIGDISGSTKITIGSGHTNTGTLSSIAGGIFNSISGYRSTIAGGDTNTITGRSSFIGAGNNNTTNCSYAFIGAGRDNTADNDTGIVAGRSNSIFLTARCSVIGGGESNTITGSSSNVAEKSFIGAGNLNCINGGLESFIGSGCKNCTTGNLSSIVGGTFNTASGTCGFIGGGTLNYLCDNFDLGFSTIGGGCENQVLSAWGFIGGGVGNIINNQDFNAVIGGGQYNEVAGSNAVIAGGQYNCACQSKSFIGGGGGNYTFGIYSAIVGGFENTAKACSNFIGGGFCNTICSSQAYATIGGGRCNTIDGEVSLNFTNNSSIVGGCLNCAKSVLGFIGGGRENFITGSWTTLGGGKQNKVDGDYSSILGGTLNTSSAACSFIGGGCQNCALGCYSIIVGGAVNINNTTHGFIGGGCNNRMCQSKFGVIAGGECNFLNCSTPGNGCYNTIGGGCNNRMCAQSGGAGNTIAGGRSNCICDDSNGTIGGGCNNLVCNFAGTVAGGCGNKACSNYSFIGGGHVNTIAPTACCSAILGGSSNCVNGHDKTFIIGSGITSTADCYTFMNNTCVAGTTRTTTLVETSAKRFKECILPLQDQIENIKKLEPVEFQWKKDKTKDIGFIAEDVKEIYPDLVAYEQDGEISGVQYSKLTTVLVKALQQQQEQIEELKKEIFIIKQQG